MELKQANKGNVRMRIALHGPSGSGNFFFQAEDGIRVTNS